MCWGVQLGSDLVTAVGLVSWVLVSVFDVSGLADLFVTEKTRTEEQGKVFTRKEGKLMKACYCSVRTICAFIFVVSKIYALTCFQAFCYKQYKVFLGDKCFKKT
jgi:hypothetical protein